MNHSVVIGDVAVNPIGYGAMHLTGSGIWGDPPNRDDAVAVVKRAVELGATLIDTAESYGPGNSERIIADALWPYPSDVQIATKGGLAKTGPSSRHPDGTPEALRRSCHASLRRLRRESIYLYQLHLVDPSVPIEESVGALQGLREQGHIHHIGVCNVTAETLARARTVAAIASVQNQLSLGHQRWLSLAKSCEQDGIAFLAYRPLDVGAPADSESEARLRETAHRNNASARQVALAWVTGSAANIVAIPGTSNAAHLEENMDAGRIRLTDADHRDLAAYHASTTPLIDLDEETKEHL